MAFMPGSRAVGKPALGRAGPLLADGLPETIAVRLQPALLSPGQTQRHLRLEVRIPALWRPAPEGAVQVCQGFRGTADSAPHVRNREDLRTERCRSEVV